ncbi:MAG: hypothetical protein KDK65_07085 [Chlamydiia bacterium]|nr:hypothetical protein [Chlamydiia bacterium]
MGLNLKSIMSKDMRMIVDGGGLHVVKQSELPFGVRFKAYFGFGPASMRNVAAYIAEHRTELFTSQNEIFDKLNNDDCNLIQFRLLRTKLNSYNSHHRLFFFFFFDSSIKQIDQEIARRGEQYDEDCWKLPKDPDQDKWQYPKELLQDIQNVQAKLKASI